MAWNSVNEVKPPQMKDVLVIRKNGEMQVAHWAPEYLPFAEWKIFSLNIDEEGYEEVSLSHDLWDVVFWKELPNQPERLNELARKGCESLDSCESKRG